MAKSFAERWAQKEADLGRDDSTTMIEFGPDILPIDAAPFLSFDDAENPQSICDVFNNNWSAADRDRLAAYIMFGSDGSGNPICVDENSKRVMLLDHEDRFNTIQFVNTSVSKLGECLLAYMGEIDPERFRAFVRKIDTPAMEEGTFWWHEAACIES
jgi:hypothetical protein